MKSRQKGFAHVEALIIVAVVGLIAFAGWLVRIRQSDLRTRDNYYPYSGTQQPETTYSSSEVESNEQSGPDDSTSIPEGPGYKITFADGWVLMKKEGSKQSYFTRENTLALAPGKPAVIKEYVPQYPPEFPFGLSISYHYEPTNPCSSLTFLQKSFKTHAGVDVYKNITLDANTYGPAPGDKSYEYCIQLKEKFVLTVGYTIHEGLTDHIDVIESVLKTVEDV
jgi:hypothetical protein